MGWFTSRRLRKITTTVALITALATACADRSERFVQLVASGDKDTATQLIKDPKKKKDWERALATIQGIREFLNIYSRFTTEGMANGPHLVFDKLNFFNSIVIIADEGLKGQTYQVDVRRWVRYLRQVGLDDTANDWEKKLLDYHLNLDSVMAERINGDLAIVKKFKGEKQVRYGRDLKGWGILVIMQKALPKARRAGFTKTADAIQNALIELRVAFPQ